MKKPLPRALAKSGLADRRARGNQQCKYLGDVLGEVRVDLDAGFRPRPARGNGFDGSTIQ